MNRGLIVALLLMLPGSTFAAAVPEVLIQLEPCSSSCQLELKTSSPLLITWKDNNRKAFIQVKIPNQGDNLPFLIQASFTKIMNQAEANSTLIPHEPLKAVTGSPDLFEAEIELSQACESLPCSGILSARIAQSTGGSQMGTEQDPNSKVFGAGFGVGQEEKYYGRMLSMDSTVIVGNPIEASSNDGGGCEKPFSSRPSEERRTPWVLLWASFFAFALCYRHQRKKL